MWLFCNWTIWLRILGEYVQHIELLTSTHALKLVFYAIKFQEIQRFDAAMSKLSFRARALDANKTLPVYHEDDVPDLPDMSSVNRVVPQMPTGMEKEEETEHHLQRAISAQQIYGEAQRLIIPTPDVVLYQTDYESLNRPDIQIPKQLIHVQAFTLEDELPNYDCDDDDSAWIDSYNKSKKPVEQITTLEFEKMIDTLEKSCSGSRVDLFTLNDAKLLVKNDNEKLITQVYTYWKEKRKKNDGATLMPTVRTEKKEGGALHEPYVAFRRRIEKMQTRKNRKNDEASYEKMLKLRRDLNRACLIMEMVKLREEKKRDLLSTTVKILETRYSNKDFQGELLFQCYDILKQRQQEHTTQQPQHKGHHEERVKRDIAADEGRKRHKLLKHRLVQQQQHQRQASETVVPKKEETYTETTIPTVTKTRAEGDITSSDKPDGKYTFKRVKGVVYQAPRYDSMGNWPWTHSVEGGGADSRFCYGCTTLQKKERCIGFARRRRGRGGRMLFDRAYSHYEDYLSESSTLDISSFQDRVPPWPHFRPRHDSTSSEDSDTHTESVTVKPLNRWYRNSNALREQPKGGGNSRPRMHPYSNKTASHTPSINNQLFLASIAANANSKTSSDHLVLNRRNKISTVARPIVSPMKNAMQIISPSRPPSTAPSSTVYQLNFPIASTNSSVVSSSHNIMHRKATVDKVETSTSSRSSSSQLIVVSSQPQQRQPLSLVQPTAYQKMLQPGSTVQINSFQVQPVPSASRSSKLNISKGLIGTSSVVTNGISSVDSAQLARVRKSLPGFNTLRRSSPEINTTNLPVTVGK